MKKTILQLCADIGSDSYPYKKNGYEVHHALLKAGIWIIEGLDLSQVQPGRYELICLPIKIVDGDGAPARAILRSIQ